MQAVNDARVPYEAVGLQMYDPSRDMLEIERQIERFFVGKAVHITELGVSSVEYGRGGVTQREKPCLARRHGANRFRPIGPNSSTRLLQQAGSAGHHMVGFRRPGLHSEWRPRG